MSKRYDLIKPLWDSLTASYENNREYRLDSPYASMDLSALAFIRNSDEEVQRHMEDIRKSLGTSPYFRFPDTYLAWRDTIKDYNRLARFYRHMGIDVEDIVYKEKTSKGREHLRERLWARRAIRTIKRKSYKIRSLSEEEIEKELLKEGLSAGCPV